MVVSVNKHGTITSCCRPNLVIFLNVHINNETYVNVSLLLLLMYRQFEAGENGTSHVSTTNTYGTAVESGLGSSELSIQNPYVMMPQKFSDSPEESRVFENPIYETGYESQYKPPITQATQKKTSTLEKAAKAAAGVVKEKISSMKRRTASTENLLEFESSGDSADYEDIVVRPPIPRDSADYEDVMPRAPDHQRSYRPPPLPPKPGRKGSRLVHDDLI